ncbi:MAG TPA: bifunctional demethylmenaquinone methyltransferase/2-methoxy-6-polyprenyl-1,4-benzoquinol methylase UbiE [Candidatus Synoicihabitans sp.]|nr:bifunctional demethylmenaquinone methyltransferase/2-methoxy-6-polyprenyl-1,4-benzoquinol methylase UbiE [Candidatus Synoicihabitans sp.]
MPDPVAVNSMFARIARRYDAANRLLSGGIDRGWRRRLVRNVQQARPQRVLDLATGSGDVAFALAAALPPATRIIGMDFCRPMLDEAVAKQATKGSGAALTFQEGDALALPLGDASMDAVTIAFGLRNVADRGQALREMHRVLALGGRVFVLEFSQPRRGLRGIYYLYLRHVLPRVAGMLTGDKGAYDYLGGSIGEFPDHIRLAEELARAGFADVGVERLTGGIVALHSGVKL